MLAKLGQPTSSLDDRAKMYGLRVYRIKIPHSLSFLIPVPGAPLIFHDWLADSLLCTSLHQMSSS